METLWLKFVLTSDATFGRGDGLAGIVDEEVQHDEYGLPFMQGRTLKSLLTAACAEIMDALERANVTDIARWERAAEFLFGSPGSRSEAGNLRVGDARLPSDLRSAIANDFAPIPNLDGDKRKQAWGRKRAEMLESVTALRRQTAMDETGAPRDETLRTMRVIVRETPFESALRLDESSDENAMRDARALLAACVKAFRRAGTGRNRGRGKLRAELITSVEGRDVTNDFFKPLREALT